MVFVLLGVKECTQAMKIISKDDRFSDCGREIEKTEKPGKKRKLNGCEIEGKLRGRCPGSKVREANSWQKELLAVLH